jgi:hypothetical protein
VKPRDVEQLRTDHVVHQTMWYDAAAARPRSQLSCGFDFHGTTTDPPGWQGAFRTDADGRGYRVEITNHAPMGLPRYSYQHGPFLGQSPLLAEGTME